MFKVWAEIFNSRTESNYKGHNLVYNHDTLVNRKQKTAGDYSIRPNVLRQGMPRFDKTSKEKYIDAIINPSNASKLCWK